MALAWDECPAERKLNRPSNRAEKRAMQARATHAYALYQKALFQWHAFEDASVSLEQEIMSLAQRLGTDPRPFCKALQDRDCQLELRANRICQYLWLLRDALGQAQDEQPSWNFQ